MAGLSGVRFVTATVAAKDVAVAVRADANVLTDANADAKGASAIVAVVNYSDGKLLEVSGSFLF